MFGGGKFNDLIGVYLPYCRFNDVGDISFVDAMDETLTPEVDLLSSFCLSLAQQKAQIRKQRVERLAENLRKKLDIYLTGYVDQFQKDAQKLPVLFSSST